MNGSIEDKDSYDFVAEAVRKYWEDTYPQDVVAFFYQKYEYEQEWDWHEELVECESSSGYQTVYFLNDFCEGQTCVKDITVVPLSEVTSYYARNELWKTEENNRDKQGSD